MVICIETAPGRDAVSIAIPGSGALDHAAIWMHAFPASPLAESCDYDEQTPKNTVRKIVRCYGAER